MQLFRCTPKVQLSRFGTSGEGSTSAERFRCTPYIKLERMQRVGPVRNTFSELGCSEGGALNVIQEHIFTPYVVQRTRRSSDLRHIGGHHVCRRADSESAGRERVVVARAALIAKFCAAKSHTSAGCLRQQNTHCDAVCGACHVGMRRAGVPPMCSAGPRRVTPPATAQQPACAPCARKWSTTPLLCSGSLHLFPNAPFLSLVVPV